MSVPAGPDLFKKTIVFFDGYCGLCNRCIDFVLKRDKKRVFLFAPLQGQTASKLLTTDCQTDSVVLYENSHCLLKSAAVIEILRRLGGIYRGAVVFKIFPTRFRDFIYDWVARNRHKWFKRRDQCRMPTTAERDQMLD